MREFVRIGLDPGRLMFLGLGLVAAVVLLVGTLLVSGCAAPTALSPRTQTLVTDATLDAHMAADRADGLLTTEREAQYAEAKGATQRITTQREAGVESANIAVALIPGLALFAPAISRLLGALVLGKKTT